MQLNQESLRHLEKRLSDANDPYEKQLILMEARDIAGDPPKFGIGTSWGNAHIHVENFGFLQGPEHAVLKAVAEGAHYLEISDFFDPFAADAGFTRACKSVGIEPILSTELMAIVDDDLEAEVREGLGVEKEGGLNINDKTPKRIYIIISGYSPDATVSEESLKRLSEVRRNQAARTMAISEKVDRYMHEKLGYGIDTTPISSARLPQERYVAEAVAHAMFSRYECTGYKLQELGVKAPELKGTSVTAAVQEAIRNDLFKTPGQPCYVEQTDAEFYKLSEVFDLAMELGGIVKLPLVFKGPEYSDIDGNAETLMKFCKMTGIHAIQVISIRNTPDRVEPIVHAFHDKGYMVDVGTEHNDMRPRPIKPLWDGGSQISQATWEIFNAGACVDVAQANGIRFIEEGKRTHYAYDGCIRHGRMCLEGIEHARER